MHAGYPAGAGAVLLVEADGLVESVEEEVEEIERICWLYDPLEVRTATDQQERERLWAGRKGVLGALGRLGAQLLPGRWHDTADQAGRGAGEDQGDIAGERVPYR